MDFWFSSVEFARSLDFHSINQCLSGEPDFLVREGVDAAHLKPVGFGPRRPIASNHTRAGRTLNRRVEFRMDERAN